MKRTINNGNERYYAKYAKISNGLQIIFWILGSIAAMALTYNNNSAITAAWQIIPAFLGSGAIVAFPALIGYVIIDSIVSTHYFRKDLREQSNEGDS